MNPVSLILRIINRHAPPSSAFIKTIENVCGILENESPSVRPVDSVGRPGGIVYLPESDFYCVVPDLHGRLEFVRRLFRYRVNGTALGSLMLRKRLVFVFLGDAMHTEVGSRLRWQSAYLEYAGDYVLHEAMDEEMYYSLGMVEAVLLLKKYFPAAVYFLKGNHENIGNEEGRGNYPFGKFALEGAMVNRYVRKFYGEAVLSALYRYEHLLPVLAAAPCFLASHAEPARPVTPAEVIEYNREEDVTYALTWTEVNRSRPGSVESTLDFFGRPECFYFAGHRIVPDLYQRRGAFIRINNPRLSPVALVRGDTPFEPERDIISI